MAEKMYYTMGEVSDMLDVTPTLLRFWEKKFDIIKPQKNKKGNRLFSPTDVRNLKTIYHLVKERGMTLDGAARQLRVRHSEISRDMEIAERLASIRALLLEVRNELGEEKNYELRIANYEFGEGEEGVEEQKNSNVPEPMDEEVVIPEPEPEPEPAPEPEVEVIERVEVVEFIVTPTPEPEPAPEPEAEHKPDPDPDSHYHEQTLF
jgi:DNA-binding transcriptional MerR regulator